MKKKELLSLIKDLGLQIKQLERRVDELTACQFGRAAISPPSAWIPACVHEYPSDWNATVPPTCMKCGQQADSIHITCSMTTNAGTEL